MPTKSPVTQNPASSKMGAKTPMQKGMEKTIVAKKGAAPKKSAAPKKGAAGSIVEVDQQRTDLDIAHFRTLLQSERDRLDGELEGLRNRTMDVEGSLPDEGESGDEDTADLASAMMDKEIDLSVEDEIMDLLSSIDHALEKMEDGTYGICDISGEAIPRSRLELIPWASLTVTCQAMSEGE